MLAPPEGAGSEAVAGDGATVDERRRTSARRLRAEVEGEATARREVGATATGAPPSAGSKEGSSHRQVTQEVAALRQCACRERAAPVALAFVQVRFPALLKSAAAPSKKPKRVLS